MRIFLTISRLDISKAKSKCCFLLIATNYLGAFHLTNRLLDRIKESSGRVINISSDAYKHAKITKEMLSSGMFHHKIPCIATPDEKTGVFSHKLLNSHCIITMLSHYTSVYKQILFITGFTSFQLSNVPMNQQYNQLFLIQRYISI